MPSTSPYSKSAIGLCTVVGEGGPNPKCTGAKATEDKNDRKSAIGLGADMPLHEGVRQGFRHPIKVTEDEEQAIWTPKHASAYKEGDHIPSQAFKLNLPEDASDVSAIRQRWMMEYTTKCTGKRHFHVTDECTSHGFGLQFAPDEDTGRIVLKAFRKEGTMADFPVHASLKERRLYHHGGTGLDEVKACLSFPDTDEELRTGYRPIRRKLKSSDNEVLHEYPKEPFPIWSEEMRKPSIRVAPREKMTGLAEFLGVPDHSDDEFPPETVITPSWPTLAPQPPTVLNDDL
ncbi:MAG: hypothetical protein KVP17_001746 [Porospora cf. gigantea B]|uniref:uncharacterized protein n=2 Tax=Porospora cf. gigantea B TaxID=2853592 RepID=UPI003571C38E|nr:MAG: hypothetical protein KVP17_001746 [Porospora cf. gigantea B]